jgi:hypothetical protein
VAVRRGEAGQRYRFDVAARRGYYPSGACARRGCGEAKGGLNGGLSARTRHDRELPHLGSRRPEVAAVNVGNGGDGLLQKTR